MGGERELIPVRRALVQLLRKAARTCDVELVRDDSGRDKVQGMAAAIRSSGQLYVFVNSCGQPPRQKT